MYGSCDSDNITRKWEMEIITFVLLSLTLSLCAGQFTLMRTSPTDGCPVCPGMHLVFECTTLLRVTWVENDIVESFVNTSAVNMPKKADRFEFILTKVINRSILISTATIPVTRPNDTGIELQCVEDTSPLIEFVSVLGGPDNCTADVSCSLSQDVNNLVVSLHHTEGNCIDGYLFEFNGQNKTSSVEESHAEFPIQALFGSEQLDQKIYTTDSEGRFGHPCHYSIKAPEPVKSVGYLLICNDSNIDLEIFFEPGFPSESCFDAESVTWRYNYSIHDTNGTTIVSDDNATENVLVHSIPGGTYKLVVVPIAVELGLSGSMLSHPLVVFADCELPSDIGSEGTDRVTQPSKEASTQPSEETSSDENQSALGVTSVLFGLSIGSTVALASIWLASLVCLRKKRKAPTDNNGCFFHFVETFSYIQFSSLYVWIESKFGGTYT